MSANDFSLVINSASAISGSLNTQKMYYFDFQTREQGRYEVSTVFLSAGTNNVATPNPATVNINWAGANIFSTTGTSTSSAASSTTLALLYATTTSTNNGY